MVVLTREQLEERLSTLHQASLELVGVLSLDEVLQRIVDMARAQAGARYAALGMIGEDGKIERFIPVGMTEEEISSMDHPPRGLGLIGALREERHPIRVPDLNTDPRGIGFPPNHPPMRSFLGVPILSGDRLLGQIYLTDKEGAPDWKMLRPWLIKKICRFLAAPPHENAFKCLDLSRLLSARPKYIHDTMAVLRSVFRDLCILKYMPNKIVNLDFFETFAVKREQSGQRKPIDGNE